MDIGFYKTYFNIEKYHWLMKVRRGIVFDAIRSLAEKGKDTSPRILDYGSGSGFLVGELQKAGFEAYGVDTSEEAIAYGAACGIRNLTTDIVDLGTGQYDIVLAMDVLEHIKEPKNAIQAIERSLKSGGHFIITVPAYMFLWGIQDEVAHHYRRYTKSGLLKEVGDSSSFKVVRSSYFNTFLFLPIAFVRLITRLFKIRGRESDFDLNSPLLNKMLFSIFNIERKLLRRVNYPFGVSIMAILKK